VDTTLATKEDSHLYLKSLKTGMITARLPALTHKLFQQLPSSKEIKLIFQYIA
jgi:hypothetical protein